jgi:hypothetical protein
MFFWKLSYGLCFLQMCLALAMAYVPFETHMPVTLVNIFIKMHLVITTSLMFLVKHRPKFIMPFR